tara:strand:- start:4617 stop:6335 length:1719 start_codon:yes stop_codon:yes gene_type:complete
MKFLTKKNYIIFCLFIALFFEPKLFTADSQANYKSKDISNYFSGIISTNQYYNRNAYEYLNRVKSINNIHSQFNVEFIRTLVLLEKFKEANHFSQKVWRKEEMFFEADLLLGINFFINEDYEMTSKYFERLNKISRYNLIFDNFFGNIMLAWNEAVQGNKKKSFEFIEKIPKAYYNITRTQSIFLKCYLDQQDTKIAFENLIKENEYNFSRYNFFLINYLLSKDNIKEAKKIIKTSRDEYNSNLLLKQTESLFVNNNRNKIIKIFNCKNPKDSLAEFFYVISNLYASEQDYQLSNFYLKISLFLNDKFIFNKALLAENLYFQKKYDESIKAYNSLKSIGEVYSWHASKNIASILEKKKGIKYAVKNLKKDFDSLTNLNHEHYYDLANFYKEKKFYKESIEYYSQALKNIKKDDFLVPKILDRRGSSYERIGDWKKAEKDLLASLKIIPDQPHVLNYLAYSWIDQGINIDEGLEMLIKASKLRENDGYIIDSLGWAYYAKKNYFKAKNFLEKAVELLPLDPIINDHYGDVLWMLNKDIQARYIWGSVLKMEDAEQELKDNVEKKLIFGIKGHL